MAAAASNNIMYQKNIMGDRKLVNPNLNHLLRAEHMQLSGIWVLNLTVPTVGMQRQTSRDNPVECKRSVSGVGRCHILI